MPEQWQVHIHRKVNDVIHALPPKVALAIRDTIIQLQQNPYPLEHRLVGSFDDVYEVFISSYRIAYQVQEEQKRVKIARVHLANETE